MKLTRTHMASAIILALISFNAGAQDADAPHSITLEKAIEYQSTINNLNLSEKGDTTITFKSTAFNTWKEGLTFSGSSSNSLTLQAKKDGATNAYRVTKDVVFKNFSTVTLESSGNTEQSRRWTLGIRRKNCLFRQ